jgi:hypothetical protein
MKMAKARSSTVSFEIQSPTTGETRVVIERSFVKSTRVAGRYVTASKQYALFDTNGLRYERISNQVVKCVGNDEIFHVFGHAEHIRKAV